MCETNDNDNDSYNSCEDCDDDNPDVYPGNTELCDGLDNDCDVATPDGTADGAGDACTDPGQECQENTCVAD